MARIIAIQHKKYIIYEMGPNTCLFDKTFDTSASINKILDKQPVSNPEIETRPTKNSR